MFNEQIETQEKKNYTLFAQNIVAAKGKKIFSKNKALSCLAKSDAFFKELTTLFNKLNLYGITPQKFKSAVENLPESIDRDRLYFCSEIYEYYAKTMAENEFEIPFAPTEIKSFNLDFAQNNEIKKRLELLKSNFEEKKNAVCDFEKTDCIKYFEFNDIQNETEFVVNFIKSCVRQNTANYSDFAVFVDKTEARQKFSDMMKVAEIPVVSSIYNENYENLKHRISVCEQIGKICSQLCLNEFSSNGFKNLVLDANLNYISKSQREICLEQLDEVLKNFVEEIFENSYSLDKILNIKEKSQKSFAQCLFSSINFIDEKEREKLYSELGTVKSFYSHYKENNYALAIESIIKKYIFLFENTNLKEIVAGKIKSLNELQNLYDEILSEKPEFSAFYEIMNRLPQDTEKDKNAVRLSSVSANLKKDEKIRYVFVSGLTENNFPGNNPSYPFISRQTNDLLCEKLKSENPCFGTFIQNDENYFLQRYFALCSIMSVASERIVFTTHSYEAGKYAQGSVFFNVLKTKDSKNYEMIEDQKIFANENIFNQTAKSFVKLCPKDQSEEKVIAEDDLLKLNPSAISTFQGCPRKYFYKNLLNLKEESNFSASYGSIVHAVFEVMNKVYLKDFGKQKALELGEILFNAKSDIQKVLDSGFGQTDADLICATDDLALAEMKENFKDAMEDFEQSGYFVTKPLEAVCEQDFVFKSEELPQVVFDGRIDAIVTYENSETCVIDYKTGKNKINTLDYALSENGVNFKSKTGKEPANIETLQNAYDYQIPIYYLACQNSKNLEQFKEKISHLGLVYVRPKSKHNGCDKDFVSAEKFEIYKDKIIRNLKETVIDKIRNENKFKSLAGYGCEYCSYKFLCDGENDDE